LHLAYNAIFEFQKAHNRLPTNSDDDQKEILELVKKVNESNKGSEGITLEEVDEEVIKNTASFARAQISPMAAFYGGIVAQEIVKFTGKYSPLKQWLHYDIFETLPKG
jgi:ubiquitin-activating enzyme E1